MTTTEDQRVGGREGDEDGLSGSEAKARMQAVAVNIMARGRRDSPFTEPRERLFTPGLVIQLPKRPTVVVGLSPSGESRMIGIRSSRRQDSTPLGPAVPVPPRVDAARWKDCGLRSNQAPDGRS